MSSSKIRAQFTPTCDSCGGLVRAADEILCTRCKHPKLVKALDRLDELLSDESMEKFFALCDAARERLDNLTHEDLRELGSTGANLALLDELCKALIATPAAHAREDGDELRALVVLISRIRLMNAS